MSGALRFLLRRTTRHRVAAQLRRVAEPRYAIAAVLGLAYLATLMRRPPRAEFPAETIAPLAVLAGSLGLAAWTAWAWTIGRRSRLAALRPPEVTFVAGGPVGDGRLLGYALLRGQQAVLPNALLWALLIGWSGAGLAAWRDLPAAWILLTTIQLHHLLATLAREAPARRTRRRVVEVAAGAAALAAAAVLGVSLWSVVGGWTGSVADLPLLARDALAAPASRLLLAPFRIAVAPLAAPSLSAWATSLPLAAAVLVSHLVVLFAARRSFRHAAVDGTSGSRGERLRRSAAVVGLAPGGAPALAVTWKNVTGVVRRRRLAAVAAGAAVTALVAVVAGRVIDPIVPQAVAAVAGIWAAGFALVGPQWVRCDLRSDLRHLSAVRSWPLPGHAIAAAQVLASTLLLTAAQFALLAVGGAVTLASGLGPPSTEELAAAAAVAGALPLLNWLHLAVHNALAVLYPGWVALGPEPRTGVEGLGQQAILLVAGLGGLVLLLLPAAAAAGAAWSVAGVAGAAGVVRRLIAAGVAVPASLLMSFVLLRVVGARLERLDPAELDADDQARG